MTELVGVGITGEMGKTGVGIGIRRHGFNRGTRNKKGR